MGSPGAAVGDARPNAPHVVEDFIDGIEAIVAFENNDGR